MIFFGMNYAVNIQFIGENPMPEGLLTNCSYIIKIFKLVDFSRLASWLALLVDDVTTPL